MATQKESGKKVGQEVIPGTPEERTDAVQAAIDKLAVAAENLQICRMEERTARSSGDSESIDSAVYERLKAEKAFRDAVRGEAQARAARAAAKAVRAPREPGA